MAKKKRAKTSKRTALIAVVVVILVIIIAACAALYVWQPETFDKIIEIFADDGPSGGNKGNGGTGQGGNGGSNGSDNGSSNGNGGTGQDGNVGSNGSDNGSTNGNGGTGQDGNGGLNDSDNSSSNGNGGTGQGGNGSSNGSDNGSSNGNGGTGQDGGAEAGTSEEISSAELSIHFLELGSKNTGDCILIKCGDTEVLIDAGSIQGCATTLKSYIDGYCEDGILEYVISTHADKDHIAAFVGDTSGSTRTGLFYQYQIDTLIKFDRTGKNTSIYNSYMEGVNYLIEQGTTVYTASQCYDERDGAQRQYYLDEEHTISLNILYNYYYYYSSSDENNYSVVTLLTQELEEGNKYYLFTGDLEEDGESKLVDYYANVPEDHRTEYNILPENVDLFKAGHHGSYTSSTAKLMEVIQPKNVVVCCVAGTTEYTVNNQNTFPSQQMIDNVGKYTENIYAPSVATGLSEYDPATDKFASRSFGGYESLNGNIVFYTVDGELKLYCSENDTILKDTEWFKTYRDWKYI